MKVTVDAEVLKWSPAPLRVCFKTFHILIKLYSKYARNNKTGEERNQGELCNVNELSIHVCGSSMTLLPFFHI